MVGQLDRLAAIQDVEGDLGRPLTDAESTRADAQIVKASALVVGHVRHGFVEGEVPAVVRVVVAGMVARAFGSAEVGMANAEQLNAGAFGVRFAAGSTSPTPYLASADKTMLAPYRRGGITSIPLVSERHRPHRRDGDGYDR